MSVDRNDSRLALVSFGDLLDCIEVGPPTVKGEYERAFVVEFSQHLQRILHRGVSMDEQLISPATMLLFRNGRRFDELCSQAQGEAERYIEHLNHRLKAIASRGEPPEIANWDDYGVLIRKKQWVMKSVEFGVAFDWSYKLGTRLMHRYDPYLYVGVFPLDRKTKKRDVAAKLLERVRPALDESKLRIRFAADDFSACYVAVPISESEDWQVWGDRVAEWFSELWSRVSGTLDDVAQTMTL